MLYSFQLNDSSTEVVNNNWYTMFSCQKFFLHAKHTHTPAQRYLTAGKHMNSCCCNAHCLQVVMSYLYQVDECRENGTSKHVVFFRLLPEQGQVLNQTAYIWANLRHNKKQTRRQIRSKTHSPIQPAASTTATMFNSCNLH